MTIDLVRITDISDMQKLLNELDNDKKLRLTVFREYSRIIRDRIRYVKGYDIPYMPKDMDTLCEKALCYHIIFNRDYRHSYPAVFRVATKRLYCITHYSLSAIRSRNGKDSTWIWNFKESTYDEALTEMDERFRRNRCLFC